MPAALLDQMFSEITIGNAALELWINSSQAGVVCLSAGRLGWFSYFSIWLRVCTSPKAPSKSPSQFPMQPLHT